MSSPADDIPALQRLLSILSTAEQLATEHPASSSLKDSLELVTYEPPAIEAGWIDPLAGKTEIKRYTLIHVVDRKNKKCLLGLKKRGLGAGLYNGFGGKFEPGESPLECAKRELFEECNLTALSMRHRGCLLFTSESPESREQGVARSPLVDLFVCDEWDGELAESEEMKPRWFDLPLQGEPVQVYESSDRAGRDADDNSMPYDQMFEEARLYVPALLSSSNETELFGRADYRWRTKGREEANGDDVWTAQTPTAWIFALRSSTI